MRNMLSGVNTHLNPEKPEPVRVLLDVYERRPDLQEAFPEVKNRNLQRLINWAAAVVSQGGFETDYSTLLAHRSWYLANANKVRATHIFADILLHVNKPLVHALKGLFDANANENKIRESQDIFEDILLHVNQPLVHSLKGVFDETDISEHLTTLSMLSVEFELRNILELGVRTGESTVALTEAASAIEGHVFSVDLYDCVEAKRRIRDFGLEKRWTFIQGNDLEVAAEWTTPIDHLFIDTTHLYSHTLLELEAFESHVRKGGFISLHDSVSSTGVIEAVKEFVRRHAGRFRFYHYVNSNGLTVLRNVGLSSGERNVTSF